ncbi:hypothetical protein SAMN05216436_12017 [bacterium A37T11]|nr:hypothetical protein SAMN05216436_12017 [bacterium A37T11]
MSKKVFQLSFLCVAVAWCMACSNKEISDRVALSEVSSYLEENPVYESADLGYGEVKFSKKKDAGMLSNYQKLQQAGFVTMELLKERKRFLSSDSTFTYLIELTDKSIPFVIDKNDKRATVKTFVFKLDDSQGIQVQKSGRTKAKATVTLTREETAFSPFASKNKGANASFTRKTYTLKFDNDAGWKVSK